MDVPRGVFEDSVVEVKATGQWSSRSRPKVFKIKAKSLKVEVKVSEL